MRNSHILKRVAEGTPKRSGHARCANCFGHPGPPFSGDVLIVYLFVCLFVYCLFGCLLVYVFICLCVYLFICLFVCFFICFLFGGSETVSETWALAVCKLFWAPGRAIFLLFSLKQNILVFIICFIWFMCLCFFLCF